MSEPRQGLNLREATGRRLIWITAGLFAALLVGGAVWTVGELAGQRRAAADLSRALAAADLVKAAAASLRETEAAERGYVLSGRAEHLEAYRQSSQALGVTLERLEAGSDRGHGFAPLVAAVDAKMAWMASVVDLRTRVGADAATAAASGPEGDRLMQAAIAEVRRVESAQAEEIGAALREQSRRVGRAQATLALMFVALAAAALGVALAVARLLTARTRLAEVLKEDARRQRAILESAHEGVLTIDQAGRIAAINPAGAAIFGYAPQELVGRPTAVLAGESEVAGLDQRQIARKAHDGGARFRIEARRKDGALVPVECSMTALKAEDGLRYVCFLRDVSERQQIEQMKDEFVSTVSHELRTPLTSIAGSLGLVAGGAAGEISAQAARLIGIAQSNCQRLVRLINDVLDVEKLEAGRLAFHMHTLDLRHVAERALAAVRGYAEPMEVRLMLVPGEPVLVNGDSDRLVQVATNLLSNAARYSPRNGEVRIEVEAVGRAARLSVSDCGPGVPEAFRERIFSRFVQADATDARGKSGAGLGLYIARQIADRHAGQLWYEPGAEGGAVFRLELPLATPAQLADRPGRRVLLVEDEPASAAVMEALLEEEGLEVDTAATLAEARAHLSARRYGALVLDLRLPDGDGVELLRELRRGEAGPPMPILVVSGDPGRRNEPEVRAVEGVDWLQKPIDLDRMAELVRAAVGGAGADGTLILHVDDDRDIRELVAESLAPLGEVVSAESLAQARTVLAERRPSVVVLDLELRDGSGADLLAETDAPVVVFSAQDARGEIDGQAARVLVKSRTPLPGLVQAVREVLEAEPAEAAR